MAVASPWPSASPAAHTWLVTSSAVHRPTSTHRPSISS
jgi:hypothetical protein